MTTTATLPTKDISLKFATADKEELIEAELQKYACFHFNFINQGNEPRARMVNAEVWNYLMRETGNQKEQSVKYYHRYMGYKKEIALSLAVGGV